MIRFDTDVKPLFRAEDRKSMAFAFDLWDCADVRKWASPILERVAEGTMPCDVPWDSKRIETLRGWAQGGFQP